MEPRGRSRARGRARSGQPQSGPPGVRPGPSQPQVPPPQPFPGQRTAWQNVPAPQQQIPPIQAPQQPRPQPTPQQPTLQQPRPQPTLQPQQPQQPQTTSQMTQPQTQAPAGPSGRGTRAGGGGDAPDEALEQFGGVQGQGDGAAGGQEKRGGGNGGVRGRSVRHEYVVSRPTNFKKQGSSGSPISLVSNYFSLLQSGKWALNQYRVDFSPEIDHTGQRKALFRTAMLSHEDLRGYLFDGTVMYTPRRLHPDPLEKGVKTDSGEAVRISVRLVGEISWGDYHYIQLFNLIIRKCLAYMKLELVSRNYYDPNAKIAIPEYKMELWPGYYTSMRQHEKSILLNVDVAFKVMRTDNVYDTLIECKGADQRKEFLSKIVGRVVLTYYNNKTYKIDDVDYTLGPTSMFPKKDGTSISFVQYYKDKYNINILMKSQPLLVSKSNSKEIRAGCPETVLLLPELCKLTGLTDKQRENFQLMRTMAEHTRIGPPERMAKLNEFSRRLRSTPEALEEIRRWDLNLSDSLIKFQGRVLGVETMVGGNNMKYPAGGQADWTKELRTRPMVQYGTITKFAIVCPERFRGPCQEFVSCLMKSAYGMKWNLPQPKIFEIKDDRTHTYLDSIESISQSRPSLIMCVLTNNSIEKYGSIKKKCCVDRGIPSQMILTKNLTSKGVMSIATKVAIQINCKVGGAPWSVLVPLSHLMVVGYDVCRDTNNKGRSFSAMVASLNKDMTRYFNSVTEHAVEQELSDNFASFMEVACHRFREVNGQFPDRILIYRDGVGDGQLPYVKEQEINNIKRKLKSNIYSKIELKLAFIVVSKRINTRIFVERGGNPPPGTVVDDHVTLPERYDFFIVSQCVRQGTVSPTNYNVLEDTMGLPADRMQQLTYKLCHMYFNWSGTVRVPAPCQYAHKLAFLTSQALHRPAHKDLETLLYYL